jgi:hypothetical protein
MRGLLWLRQAQGLMEDDFVVFHRRRDAGARHKAARQNQLRQWILDPALDRTFEWPCAIHRVVTDRDQLVQRFVSSAPGLSSRSARRLAQAAQLDLE